MPSKTDLRLPLEADADDLERALFNAFDAVENAVNGMKALDCDFGGEDSRALPEVTTEHIAALANVRSTLRARLIDLERFAIELDSRLDDAILLRGEQQYQQRRRPDAE
jgi:hypothetical protein